MFVKCVTRALQGTRHYGIIAVFTLGRSLTSVRHADRPSVKRLTLRTTLKCTPERSRSNATFARPHLLIALP
ncbi:unnamed protein product [Arctia plantaginis]|uniref:Uncharacterized protein n=1 Tax=Arctia plantaginis TaxID=874455 RepID=A0A8S1BEZ2_ARCPL|nr:unnamed protein product [Arctia plantaginis]